MHLKRKILSNILIMENVISQEGLKHIMDYVKNNKAEDLSVFDAKKSNETKKTEWKIDKEVRDTKVVNLNQEMFQNIFELYKNIVTNIINPYYEFEILDSEIPQLLKYEPGGFYKPHIDGESLWTELNGDVVWRKSTDRDLSTLIYLNDDFEGGDFYFPDLKLRIRPEPGLLVCFPSTHHYLHTAEPVVSGERYCIVNWMRVKGFTTLEDVEKHYEDKYQKFNQQ